jgi:hypothetical protein
MKSMDAPSTEVEYKIVTWSLINADPYWRGVPEEVVRLNTQLFGIYVSDLPKEEWSWAQKAVPIKVIVMNPWSRSEIHRV